MSSIADNPGPVVRVRPEAVRMARALRAGCVSVAIAGIHVGLLRTMGVMASSVTRKRSEYRSVFCESSY